MVKCADCGDAIMFDHDNNDEEIMLCAACAEADEVEITETHYECPECDHTTIFEGDVIEDEDNPIVCEKCGFIFPLDEDDDEEL
jgi:predicted RNA-binding Zn-ribbon protein involved in translation (DUF1610 family)